jgi:hypothetical protein
LAADPVRAQAFRGPGDDLGGCDLERGEVKVQAGRVLLDGHRTATDDPKSTASRRTVPVEQIQPGTVALLRSLKARQASDRLALGQGYLESGLVLVELLGAPIRPESYSDRFAVLCPQAGLRKIDLHYVHHTLAGIMHRAGVAPADRGISARSHAGRSPVHLRPEHRARSLDRCQRARGSSGRGAVKFS